MTNDQEKAVKDFASDEAERNKRALALADKLNSLCVAELAWEYLNDAASLLREFACAKPTGSKPDGGITQFRTVHCADWYDGPPGPTDGGGPYETRTLYVSPPPAAAQADAVSEGLVISFDIAVTNLAKLHTEYMGKAMPDDVYDTFYRLREETVPTLRKKLIAALAGKPAGEGVAQAYRTGYEQGME